MKNSWIFTVAVGTACLGLGLSITYACKDFLDTPAQGTLNENALATKAGVEGSLIAAFRSLDCSNATNGKWGGAASNWQFGRLHRDVAYKSYVRTFLPQLLRLLIHVW